MTRDAEQQKYSEIVALVSVTVGREQFRNAEPRFYTAWVKRVILTGGRQLPVFPNKQTFSVFAGMSQTCQKRSYGKSNKTKALGWEWREESP